MTALNYDVLRTSKAALDEGLIDQTDYDAVKRSFLRAQQIKAGLDAGFIPEAEYTHVKRAFLESLNIGMASPEGTTSTNNAPGKARKHPDSAAYMLKLSQVSLVTLSLMPAAVPARTLGASQKASETAAMPQHVPSQPAAPRTATHNADQSAAPGKSSTGAAQEQRATTARPSAAAAAAVKKVAAPAPAAAQNGSAVRLGRVEVPSNIPNLGGRRPKQAQAVQTLAPCAPNFSVNSAYTLGCEACSQIRQVLLYRGCASVH